MVAVDTTSPGFVVSVISLTPEIRVRGRADARTLGQILDQMTDVTERVLTFTYEDSEKEHDVLRLKVDNHDLYFFDHPAWVKGNLVRFFFGYPNRIFGPRFAIVDGFRGFRELTVTCVEPTALSNVPRTRKFETKTRVEIVKQLVAEGAFPGVTNTVTKAVAGETPRTWTQARQSDWQFLQRLAEGPGYEVFIEGPRLHFHPRRFELPPLRRFEYFFGVGDLVDFNINEWRVVDRAAETQVSGRDPIARKNIKETGSDANTTRDTLGNQNTVKITRKGLTGELKVTPGSPPQKVAGKTINTTPERDPATVKNEADARFRRQEQSEVKATATIIGDPLLPAKSIIEVVGISRQLSGKYYVKRHVHEIDRDRGYRGTLTLLKDALRAMPTQDPPSLNKTKASENRKPVLSGERRRQLVIKPEAEGTLKQFDEAR